MAISTITGLGSGLDIDSLVTALVDAESVAKQSQIDTQTEKAELTLSAIGTLKSAVETFEASLSSLQSVSSNFDKYQATSSDEAVATVEMDDDVVAGTYALNVTQLAAGSKVASAAFAEGASTSFASGGTLTISVGENASYEVDVAAGASLTDIRDAINEQLGSSTSVAGITANIVTDGNGARLVLSSETTGVDTDLAVSGTGDLSALDINNSFDEDGNRILTEQSGTEAGYITLAADAEFTLDGMSLTSSTNTVTALSGLTISLEQEGETSITVGTNTEGLQTSVETFVSAYNTLITMTNALTKVESTDSGDSTTAGALVGDSSVRSMLNSIRKALVEPAEGNGQLSILAQLGVTTASDGSLEVDSEKLEAGISTYSSEIASFFTGDDGLLDRITSITAAYTETGGILDSRETRLENTLTDLDDQQEALDRRIETLTETLYSKYNNMDSLVSQLNATSESVLASLEALAESNSSD